MFDAWDILALAGLAAIVAAAFLCGPAWGLFVLGVALLTVATLGARAHGTFVPTLRTARKPRKP